MIDRFSLNYQFNKRNQLKSKRTWIGVGFILLCIVGLNVYGCLDANISLNQNNLKVHGIYWAEIGYKKISQINLVQNLPEIETKTNGFAFMHYDKGHFELHGVGYAELWVDVDTPPFLHIKTKDGKTFYLNYSNAEKTRKLYGELKTKVSLLIFH